MEDSPWFPALTRCPRCRAPDVTGTPEALTCAACGTAFPVVGGIPWLFAAPTRVMAEWLVRLRVHEDELATRERLVKQDLATTPPGRKASQRRLQKLREGLADQRKCLEKLMAPVVRYGAREAEALRALGGELALSQAVFSYYDNLFRDWAWGDAEPGENAAMAGIVTPLLAEAAAGRRVLVVGAGACRLAYDMHRAVRPAATVALDINPLLFQAAQRIIRGKTATLWEFPVAPRDESAVAVKHALEAPEALGGDFTFVMGDALDLPFRDGAFDVVLTPWLIDILDASFAALAPGVNRVLAPGGVWVNAGTCHFEKARPRDAFVFNEVLESLGESGFKVAHSGARRIPYMQSPHSAHGRVEEVFAFAATKASEAPHPGPVAAGQPLPPWLKDDTQAIPALPFFAETIYENRLFADVLSQVDGRRSLADLAAAFGARHQLATAEAREALGQFLAALVEKGKRAGRLVLD